MNSFLKNTWQLFAYLMLLVACSDDKIEEQTTITLPPDTEALFEKGVNFTTSASTQKLEFTAAEDWNITAAATRNGEIWYQIFPTSGGPGKADVIIKVDENKSNDDRSVAITINSGKTKKTLMVSQKQKDALLVTSNRMEVKQEGGTLNIEVNANIKYKAVIADDCQSWIKPTQTSTRGMSASTISFKVTMNGERDKREGEIYITDGTLTQVVTVYQHGGNLILLNENEYPVGDRGETIKVELNSNCLYGVKMPDVGWIREATMSRGMSSHTIYYTVSANDRNESRRAKIIFYDKDNVLIADTLTVIQAQKDAVVVDNQNINLETPNDTVFAIDVNANVDVEVRPADTCQWITESTATRGLQLRKIYLKAAKNESFSPRRGRVLIKNKNSSECDTLKIWQPGKPTTVKLEQTELDVPMQGGTYRIKIDADVAVKMNKWSLLWPEGGLEEEPGISIDPGEIFGGPLFQYENKARIPYQANLSADGQYLEVSVEPAVSAEATSATVTVYGKYENKEAKLTIRQEPDPVKIVRLRLTSNGDMIFGGLFSDSYQALKHLYTLEELYTRQSEVEQGYYDWSLNFINHTLNAYDTNIDNAWSTSYTTISRMVQTKTLLQSSLNQDLHSADSTAVMALLDMHCFILYSELTDLWGKAVLPGENSWDPIEGIKVVQKDELLKSFVEPLSLLREYLPRERVEQSSCSDLFFPSRDLSSLLLARIYMELGKYAEVKSILAEIVGSGRYQLGDLIYQLPSPQTAPNAEFRYVENVCFSYAEVLLTLSECESRLGNVAQATDYLDKVIAANVGSPAYSSSNVMFSSDHATHSTDSFISRLANTWQSQLKGNGTYFAFLKRNDIAESMLNVPTWRLVFPIPMRELHMNPEITQNEGY